MKINGKEIQLKSDIVLSMFLKEQGFNLSKIAVMKNGDIIPKSDYSQTMLKNNDSLEVVSFVGGG